MLLSGFAFQALPDGERDRGEPQTEQRTYPHCLRTCESDASWNTRTRRVRIPRFRTSDETSLAFWALSLVGSGKATG